MHIKIICTSVWTDNHASTSSLNFFTGGMLFLTPNEQHQSIEGRVTRINIKLISLLHGPKIMSDDFCTPGEPA